MGKSINVTEVRLTCKRCSGAGTILAATGIDVFNSFAAKKCQECGGKGYYSVDREKYNRRLIREQKNRKEIEK